MEIVVVLQNNFMKTEDIILVSQTEWNGLTGLSDNDLKREQDENEVNKLITDGFYKEAAELEKELYV